MEVSSYMKVLYILLDLVIKTMTLVNPHLQTSLKVIVFPQLLLLSEAVTSP